MKQKIPCFRSFESMTHVFMDMTVKETAKTAFGFTAVPFYVIVNKVELVVAIVILWHISSRCLQPHYLLQERNTCYEVFCLFMIIGVDDTASLYVVIIILFDLILLNLYPLLSSSYPVSLLSFYHHHVLLYSTCISFPPIRAVTSSAAVSHLH